MIQNIKIIYSILSLCCIVFLTNCDDTNFQAKKISLSPAKGSSDIIEQPKGVDDKDQTIGPSTSQPTVVQTQPQPQPQPKIELKDPNLRYLQEHPENQEGRPVKVCIAYTLPASGHSCDQAKFDLFFNNNVNSYTLNLDNYTKRMVTAISWDVVKVANGARVPGTLYTTKWQKDGSITTTLKCKDGQAWGIYKCHVGTAVISIIGEVKLSDGSIKYLSTGLVQFQTFNEATQSFSYTDITDGKTIGGVKFHLSDTPYEFDDYCGFKK